MKKRFIIFLAMVVFVSAGFISVYQTKAEELSSKLKGRILLQIESHGEAWYVNPKDSKRYYMANGAEAYSIMRTLGVGVTNINLAKIKTNKTFAKTQQGKIFLQIESHGEAYYIDTSGNAHYLKDGAAAYEIMRSLGLGIKTNDLIKINLSDKDTATSTVPVVGQSVTYEFKTAPTSVFVKYDFSKLISLLDSATTTNPALYSFYLGSAAGFPPTGVVLGVDGVLRGSPTKAGTNKFQVCVMDTGGKSDCRIYSLTVTSTTIVTTKISCPANSHQSLFNSSMCSCAVGYETNSAGDGCVAVPNKMPVRGRITDKDTGALVEGATVKVAYQDENGIDKSVVVNSGGSAVDSVGNNYVMYLPYYLPGNVVVSVNAGGYLPASLNVTVDASLEQEGKYRLVNFDLTPVSDKTIVIDNQLHHLGDNSYSGAVNSQFQLSAEGTQYSRSFTVTEQQLKYPKAFLVVTTKGTQDQNQMTLNGQNIGVLCCSAGDGSFGTLQWELNMSTLKQDSNQITIAAGMEGSDYDDFEFIDMMIEFRP